MHRLFLVPALLLFLTITPASQAAGTGLGKLGKGERTVYGMVDSVQGKVLTLSNFKKKAGELKDRKIRLDDGTKITANGQPADVSVLTNGQTVIVTLKHGVALQIQVTTKN